jgi:hypothetical protein
MDSPEQDGAIEERAPGGVLRRTGLRLAVTAPAVLAALHTGVAAAADDKPKPHDPPPAGADDHHSSVKLPLSRVSATSGGDLGGGGSDALDRGQVHVQSAKGSNDTEVTVAIKGSDQRNADYQLQFRHYNDHGSDNIGGTFRTNDHGDFHGRVGTLSGNHRVGVFVIQRGGTDQYVTSVNL